MHAHLLLLECGRIEPRVLNVHLGEVIWMY